MLKRFLLGYLFALDGAVKLCRERHVCQGKGIHQDIGPRKPFAQVFHDLVANLGALS